jgi:uncharacterized protein (DUF1697 family)
MTSSRRVALLRAINVGGHTVKMTELRATFEAIGCIDVETFIASGNVLFGASDKAPELERRIEATLREALGYDVDTFIRTPTELRAVTKVAVPTGAAWNVAFLKSKPSKAKVLALADWENAIDRFVVDGREVHWSCAVKQSESKFSNAKLEKLLGGPATMRSITTVQRLAALLEA